MLFVRQANAAAADVALIEAWRTGHQTSETFSGVADVHVPNVQFVPKFWSDLHGKGADGVMMWSLYNTAFMFNFPDPARV